MTARDVICTSALAGVLLVLEATSAYAFPWSTDMFRGAAVQPFALPPRVMPEGTLPQAAAAAPAPPHAGEQLFATYCAACHGPAGRGGGPVAFLLKVPPPDLTSAAVARRDDAELVAAIGAGTGTMLGFNDALSPAEQWAVVRYLRSLREAAP